MTVTVVSFYTPTWEYPQHAERLKAECEALGVPHHIIKAAPRTSWLENTRIKPYVIRQALHTLHAPVLWIDVDGSLLRRPDLFDGIDVDFMGRHQRTGPKRTWHVGTMFFNYTPTMLELVDKWCSKADAAVGSGSDEAAFEAVWLAHAEELGVTYREMPEQYFRINTGGDVPSDTVVMHRLSRCPSKLDMKRRRGIEP